MLSAEHKDGHLRRADNLVPHDDGFMETRKGAAQLLEGRCGGFFDWDYRSVCVRNGRIVVWLGDLAGDHEDEFVDIAPAGTVFHGVSFQALTQNAEREDRFYVADGVNRLWYIAFRPDQPEVQDRFVQVFVTNLVLQSNGQPFSTPIPQVLGVRKNRLWYSEGSNRVGYSEFDRPHALDPLGTIELLGVVPEHINCIETDQNADQLIVGSEHSIWAITGDSEFNFQRTKIFDKGTVGYNALAFVGRELYLLSHGGLYSVTTGDQMAGDMQRDLDDLGAGDLVADRARGLLYILAAGRLFVKNLAARIFGEITNVSANGLYFTNDRVHWYGYDGVWRLEERFTSDRRRDGVSVDIKTRYEMWPQQPNTNGNRRSLLQRVFVRASGVRRQKGQYDLFVDGAHRHSADFRLSLKSDDDLPDDTPHVEVATPVVSELPIHTAGQTFVHVVSAVGFLRLYSFDTQFGGI